MARIYQNLFDIGYMDTLAGSESPLHRLDPRAKLITTLTFIVTVVSFDKYVLSAMVPFFIFPLVQIALGNLPAGYLLKKVLIVSPFAILIGIFNPLLDRQILYTVSGLQISGGWISFASILMRFILTVTAALVLIALTGFHTVCLALKKIGVPRAFVIQLLFLYRYLFVLTEEAARLVRARTLRSFDAGGMGFKPFTSMVGHLLLRTLDRAQRVHLAMRCRGFDGDLHILRPMKIGTPEILYVGLWSLLFAAMRMYNLPMQLGLWITGGGG